MCHQIQRRSYYCSTEKAGEKPLFVLICKEVLLFRREFANTAAPYRDMLKPGLRNYIKHAIKEAGLDEQPATRKFMEVGPDLFCIFAG